MGIDVIMLWGCEIKRIIKDKMIEKGKTDYFANSIFLRQNLNNGEIILIGICFHSQILQNGYEKLLYKIILLMCCGNTQKE